MILNFKILKFYFPFNPFQTHNLFTLSFFHVSLLAIAISYKHVIEQFLSESKFLLKFDFNGTLFSDQNCYDTPFSRHHNCVMQLQTQLSPAYGYVNVALLLHSVLDVILTNLSLSPRPRPS